MAMDDDGRDHRAGGSPEEARSEGESPGEEPPEEGTAGPTTGDEEAGARGRGVVGTVLSAIAWVIGLALILSGLLAMSGSGVAGLFYLIPGLVITPRTRQELKELCRAWGEQ